MFNNPLIRRYRFSLMRPAQFWVYTAIYITVVVSMLLINYSIYDFKNVFKSLNDLHASLYIQLLIIESLMLLLWATINSSSAVSLEKLERTYDFFKMLPLPAYKKMLGIILGKNLIVFLLAAINLLFLVFYAIRSQIRPAMIMQTLFALVSAACLFNTGGLLLSLCSKRKNKASKIVGIIFLLTFGMPLLINGIMAFSQINKLEGKLANFYSLKLPVLVLAGLIAIYYTVWNIVGILRKLNKDDQPLFTKTGAFIFLAVYFFIVIGLVSPLLKYFLKEMLTAYWWLTLVPIVIIPKATFYNTQNYLEISALYRRKNCSLKKLLIAFLGISNISFATVTFGLWVTATYFLKISYNIYIPRPIHIILILASFYMFLMLLLEITKIYEPEEGKIALLAGFIAAAYFILPPIFGSIFEREVITTFSPLGFLVITLTKGYHETYDFASICLYNLLLSAGPAVLILKKYSQFIKIKQMTPV